MQVTVVVPTFNEAPNIAELVRRIEAATRGLDAEILFVDDSTDNTPQVIQAAGWQRELPVRLIHRDVPEGGLSGAVITGLRAAESEWCVVMDGDLQHPPEMIPELLAAGRRSADVAVASRYVDGGSSAGLSDGMRKLVSSGATLVSRMMFPRRLRWCTDPMTGFFAVRRAAVDLDALRPQGFKILLEILARQELAVVERPFTFAERFAGESKADLKQGVRFIRQLAALRFGEVSKFALVGAVGTVANLAIMAFLLAVGVGYLPAAIVAAAVTIVGNFVAQERLVFATRRSAGPALWRRFATSVGFNATEAALRLPVLALLVETLLVPSLVAQAVTLAAAFVVRYLFHTYVVYRPRRIAARRASGAGTAAAAAGAAAGAGSVAVATLADRLTTPPLPPLTGERAA